MLVIGSLGRGGSERQIVHFVRAVHPERARCRVVCLSTEGDLAGSVREVGADVVAVGFEGIKRSAPRAVSRLAAAIRGHRPDVVYSFLFWGYSLAIPTAALVAPRASRVSARRSLPDSDRVPHPALRVLRAMADHLSHTVIANSEAVAQEWRRTTPSLARKLRVVSNGTPLPAAPRPPIVRDPPVVVCVANLIDYKGHRTLIEAASQLRAAGHRFELLLVGDGPERPALERDIAERDLRSTVRLLGRRPDVPEILRQADVAVLASYTEGMPNAVLEAMAHALPVVATDVGGVREVLGGTGVVVAPRDADALARGLAELLDDPEHRRRLGDRARRRAAEEFSIEAMAENTLSVFRELADPR